MFRFAIFLFVMLFTANLFAENSVENLAWLAGCWERNADGQQLSEQWMKPSGKMMLGMGRRVEDGKTIFYEFLQIRENSDRSMDYVALPSGQKETSFKLIRISNNEAIFENPEHDFPQRVVYRLDAKDSLVAYVEGMDKGKHRKEEFPMKRVACE